MTQTPSSTEAIRPPLASVSSQRHPARAKRRGMLPAAMAVGTVALLVLAAHPIVLGALVREGRLSDPQVGYIATVEILALALGAGLGSTWLKRGGLRIKVALALLIVILLDLCSVRPTGIGELLALRGMAGLCQGCVLSATVMTILQGERPDRLNGIFLAMSTVPQVMLVIALPVLVIPRFGAAGGFVTLAGCCAFGLALTPWLADLPPAARPDHVRGTIWSYGVIACLLGVFLQSAAVGGAWDYVELLASGRGYSTIAVSAAMAGCLSLQVIGALAVAGWGAHLPVRAAICFSTIAQAAIILALVQTDSAAAFVSLMLMFGLFWMAVSPLQVRLLLELEPTRQAAELQSPATLAGLCVGPTICGLAIAGHGISGVFLSAVALMLGSFALYALVGTLLRR